MEPERITGLMIRETGTLKLDPGPGGASSTKGAWLRRLEGWG